jgi:hypothetical protein
MSDKDQKAKIGAKIRALLAMTVENGCTESEALGAAEKAAELMRDYQLSLSDTEVLEDGFETNFLKRVRIDEVDAYIWIANAIAEFTDTQAWRNRDKRTLRFFGLKADADFAIWLCHSLGDFIVQGARGFLAEQKAQHRLRSNGQFGFVFDSDDVTPAEDPNWVRVKSSYILGATFRISERLRQLAEERKAALAEKQAAASATGTALAVIDNKRQLVTAELARQGIKIKFTKGRERNIDSSALRKGVERGNAATFNRPIGGGGQSTMIGR